MNNADTSLMIELIEMDETVTLQQQLGQEIGPVILINKFNVKPEEVDQLLAAWTADAAFFKRQPGFISAQLHRGVGGSCVFVNYAVWESVEHFRRAFSQPEFREATKAYPPSTTTSPHLFQKVAVSNICVA
jgi:heme-degrading monooxygenase HmoA